MPYYTMIKTSSNEVTTRAMSALTAQCEHDRYFNFQTIHWRVITHANTWLTTDVSVTQCQ
jgi:hypothetical protein